MSLTLEGQTLLATNQKLVDIIVEERHTSDCYRAGLTVLKIKTLLKERTVKERNYIRAPVQLSIKLRSL